MRIIDILKHDNDPFISYDGTISKVIELMKVYDIDIPFINVRTNEVLYCKNCNEEINNTLKRIMVL